MRNIRFRALKLDGSGWFYWGLLDELNPPLNKIIDKETLGQYTGLLDEKRKEIYEGDIAAELNDHMEPCNIGVVRIGLVDDMKINGGEYGVNYCGVYSDLKKTSGVEKETGIEFRCNFENWNVIGNIYQNPKLLL